MFELIIYLAVGALIGWIAGKIMKVKLSLVMRIILGICGSAVGSIIANVMGFSGGILFSVIGACLLLFIVGRISNKQ